MKAVTVRLPVTTIAKIKYLEEVMPKESWESRQEMLFEMIESSIQDWIEKQPNAKQIHERFQEEARRALQTRFDQPNATRASEL